MITTIVTPWEDKFYRMVAECESTLRITSPFIKSNVVSKLFEHIKQDVHIDVVTSCKLMNFYRRATDIEALSYIINKGGSLLNLQNLHSKVYIFDENKAIITSSNLTTGGLKNNYEYGIEISEHDLVKDITKDFDDLRNDERTGKVELSELNKIKEIIDALPKESKIVIPKVKNDEDEKDVEIFTGDIKVVESKLTGWVKDVFVCLLEIPNEVFSLNEIYSFEKKLSTLHPENRFVTDKIRQQLQKLRDIGLIQFLGNGRYKKLWS